MFLLLLYTPSPTGASLVIPKPIAQQGGIYEPGTITIENVKDGILIEG
jgi:hypothetical protein